MEGNLLLEQFSRYKKLELEASPFHFLLDANIELNPHQINAFCAAIQALKTGGIVLADEVGLGKTIEAGLVLKYVLESGAKRVLIALPASLRKQWELELEDKFNLESVILDRITVEKDSSDWRKRLTDNNSVRIVITTYDYSSKLMKRFPEVKWDFIIIDEAHNLRNVFHGTKRAKNLYELSKGIPKILLTATPLQNSLTDLHGLVSFIDQRIFGSEKVFIKRYIEGQDYQTCNTTAEFKKAFDKLDRKLNANRDKKARELRSILLTESSGAKEQALEATKADIARYLHDVEYWSAFDELEVDGGLHYWKVDNWGEKVLGSHGILFIGAFCDSSKLLFPVLLLCDEKGDYCNENDLGYVKPIVLIACKDTDHAKKIRVLIDSDDFQNGKYKGKVIEIHSKQTGEESEENIRLLLSIESSSNPIEIVLHVYKLKEGWDVNNLFTIIPLNAAKSEILAMQTIGRGLRLPFGEQTGNEDLDSLDIVAHDHYREIVDEIKSSDIFRYRDLDKAAVEPSESVGVSATVDDGQLSLLDFAITASGVKSFAEVSNPKTQLEIYQEYVKNFMATQKKEKNEDSGQMTLFDLNPEMLSENSTETAAPAQGQSQAPVSGKSGKQPLTKDEFVKAVSEYFQN